MQETAVPLTLQYMGCINTSKRMLYESILDSSMQCLQSILLDQDHALSVELALAEVGGEEVYAVGFGVAGITSLGFDHMELLGNTLDLIATEKAGIMRPGVPCFTVPQPPEAMQALQVHCWLLIGTQQLVCSSTAQGRAASNTS